MQIKKMTLVKGILVLFSIIGLLWFNQRYLQLHPQVLREWILSYGWISPFIFMILYTMRPLILFPASVLSLAGGLAFGAVWGTVYTIIGATCGAVLSFWVARKLGHNLVKKEWTGKAGVIQQQLEERGFFYVLLLRLLPIFNFDLISYLSGISKVRFTSFLLATLTGIIPGTFAYNYLGSSFADGSMKNMIFAALLFLSIIFFSFMIGRVYKKRSGIDSKME